MGVHSFSAPELGILCWVLEHLRCEAKDQPTLCSLSLLFAGLCVWGGGGVLPCLENTECSCISRNFTERHSQLRI